MRSLASLISRRKPAASIHLRTLATSRPLRGKRSPPDPNRISIKPPSLNHKVKHEEERFVQLRRHDPEYLHPAFINEVFNERYKVVTKLAFGHATTSWLCRDLASPAGDDPDRGHYVTVKLVAAVRQDIPGEGKALEHVAACVAATTGEEAFPERGPSEDVGVRSISVPTDRFTIEKRETRGFEGRKTRLWTCLGLVFDPPLAGSLRDVRLAYPNGRLPLEEVKRVAYYLLHALDFLHTRAQLAHLDIREENVRFARGDDTYWRKVEIAEQFDPSPRAIRGNRVIRATRVLDPPPLTIPILCNFGAALFGLTEYKHAVTRDLPLAPEILMRIPFGTKSDIWAFGFLLWRLVEGTPLAANEEGKRGSERDFLMRVVNLLGPVPPDMWKEAKMPASYLDEEGKLIVAEQDAGSSLESELTALDGEDKAEFLRFLRRMLEWDPVKRATAGELRSDPWLAETGRRERAAAKDAALPLRVGDAPNGR